MKVQLLLILHFSNSHWNCIRSEMGNDWQCFIIVNEIYLYTLCNVFSGVLNKHFSTLLFNCLSNENLIKGS